MRPFLLDDKMTIDDLYALIEVIEFEKKYLFIVYDHDGRDEIGIDVLDYDTEDEIGGGWFDTIKDAYEFIKEYEDSL